MASWAGKGLALRDLLHMGPAGLRTPLSVEGTVSPLGTQSSQSQRSSAFPGRRFKAYNYTVKALISPAHRTCLNGRLQHCPVPQGTPVNPSQDGCSQHGQGAERGTRPALVQASPRCALWLRHPAPRATFPLGRANREARLLVLPRTKPDSIQKTLLRAPSQSLRRGVSCSQFTLCFYEQPRREIRAPGSWSEVRFTPTEPPRDIWPGSQ